MNLFKETPKIHELIRIGKNYNTAPKMKFFLKDFFSKYDQICGALRIWLHLLKKSLMENLIFRTA